MVSSRAKFYLFKSSYRGLSALLNKPLLTQAFHTMPNGDRRYTHDEFMENYRKGFKEAKGEETQTASQGYTKAQVDAAGKQGVELANLFIGKNYRTHHDNGFKHGEVDALKTTINITDENKRAIKTAYDEGYKIGLDEQFEMSSLRNQIFAAAKAEEIKKIIAEENIKLNIAKIRADGENAQHKEAFRKQYFRELYKFSEFSPINLALDHAGKLFLLSTFMLYAYYRFEMNYDKQLENELHTYGENKSQHLSRKETEKECKNLFAISQRDPEQFTRLQDACKEADNYLQEMKLEMIKRRKTGFGDQQYFGNRYLKNIYKDNIQAKNTPALLADKIKLKRP